MARGWESKSVESQIEAQIDQDQSPEVPGRRVALTAEGRALALRLESLRLSRSRLLQQLETARHAAHREVLMRGLKAIEKQIEDAETPT